MWTFLFTASHSDDTDVTTGAHFCAITIHCCSTCSAHIYFIAELPVSSSCMLIQTAVLWLVYRVYYDVRAGVSQSVLHSCLCTEMGADFDLAPSLVRSYFPESWMWEVQRIRWHKSNTPQEENRLKWTYSAQSQLRSSVLYQSSFAWFTVRNNAYLSDTRPQCNPQSILSETSCFSSTPLQTNALLIGCLINTAVLLKGGASEMTIWAFKVMQLSRKHSSKTTPFLFFHLSNSGSQRGWSLSQLL